ncbi:MAG: hypothetical protein J6N52_03555 [Clostridia bacterium]|nr:hypothetical protein [Clostridia bacterium]
MKNYIKGILTGILIGAVVTSVPAVAENIDALLNTVRININGIDRIHWDEDMELEGGGTAPSSILCNSTTYLPIRKISELTGNKVYWNGDSKTVSVTGMQKNVTTVAEKADKNGNVWRYYTFKDENEKNFLGITDEARGYERVYLLASNSVRVTDDEIYFVRLDTYNTNLYANQGKLMKIVFENDKDTQDGESVGSLTLRSNNDLVIGVSFETNGVVFDGDWVYYAGYIQSNASPHGQLSAYNYITGEQGNFVSMNIRQSLYNLKLVSSDEDKAVISYTPSGDGVYNAEETSITFNKTTAMFK